MHVSPVAPVQTTKLVKPIELVKFPTIKVTNTGVFSPRLIERILFAEGW